MKTKKTKGKYKEKQRALLKFWLIYSGIPTLVDWELVCGSHSTVYSSYTH